MRTLLAAVATVACGVCAGDVIHLNDGGIVVGRVVRNDEEGVVVVERDGTKTTLAAERIKKVEKGTPEEIYARKAEKVKHGDADAHYRLGVWCGKVRLEKEARSEFEKALALEREEAMELVGLSLDEDSVGAMEERYAKWKEDREKALKALASLPPDKRREIFEVKEGSNIPAVASYGAVRSACEKHLKKINGMSAEAAKRRLTRLLRLKERYDSTEKALVSSGGEAPSRVELTLAEALLRSAADPRKAVECSANLTGWRRQLFVEAVSTRVENYNKTVRAGWKGIARWINDYRRAMGLLPLVVDERLSRAAQKWAAFQNTTGYVGHVTKNKAAPNATPQKRAALEGYEGNVGENAFKGRENDRALKALQAWLQEPHHHRTLLREEWRAIGVGVSGPVVVADFGDAAPARSPCSR